MKKFLILFALAIILPCHAKAAQPLTLKLGGYLNAYFGYANVDAKYIQNPVGLSGTLNHFDVMTDGKIFFSGETVFDNGLKAGFMTKLKVTDDSQDKEAWIDEIYATFDSTYGRAIIGSTDNVAVMQHISAPSAGYLDVEATKFINWGVYNLSPLDATYLDFDDKAQKVSYISPRYLGFSVAASWVPGTSFKGQTSNYGYRDESVIRPVGDPGFRGAYVVSGNYEYLKETFKVKASGAYANIDVIPLAGYTGKQSQRQDWSLGLSLGYKGFTFGGAFHDADLGDDEKNPYAFDFGLGYETEKYALSAAYFESTQKQAAGLKDKEFQMYQAAGKYKLGAGVDIFASFAYLENQIDGSNATALAQNGGLEKNQGWVLVSGIAIKF